MGQVAALAEAEVARAKQQANKSIDLAMADTARLTIALTESMALRSLYVVPRYNPETRRIICLVNYYSHDLYRFSDLGEALGELLCKEIHLG